MYIYFKPAVQQDCFKRQVTKWIKNGQLKCYACQNQDKFLLRCFKILLLWSWKYIQLFFWYMDFYRGSSKYQVL